MSGFAPKPSLAKLPPELLEIILSHLQAPYGQSSSLFRLSHTCQRLRQLALPLCWQHIEIYRVQELGLMRELFRGSPSIGLHVHSFHFTWDMDGDYRHWYELLPAEEGTMLDLAFRDRWQMWEELRERYGCETREESEYFDVDGLHFEYDGDFYVAPGRPLPEEEGDDAGRLGGDGPDGWGQDKLVKSAADFNDSVDEVVAQLTFLKEFSWCCHTTPISRCAFSSLSKVNSLRVLHLNFSARRSNVYDLPFWELAGKLTLLVLDFDTMYEPTAPADGAQIDVHTPEDEEIVQLNEAACTSVEVPLKVELTNKRAREKLHLAIAGRTIVSAARGGQLRVLRTSTFVQQPFAVRALLPFWVQIDEWEGSAGSEGFQSAAVALRQLLVHISQWLLQSAAHGVRHDRLLSTQDIKSLRRYFEEEGGIPQVTQAQHWDPGYVNAYLTWLAEDAELARKVADAWNAVVERGEADKVRCSCEKCRKARYAAIQRHEQA